MADETTDLSTTIADAAANPRSVKGDEAEIESRDLRELIEADKYLAGKAANSRPKFGLRSARIILPGSC